jgi:hypothetical protein
MKILRLAVIAFIATLQLLAGDAAAVPPPVMVQVRLRLIIDEPALAVRVRSSLSRELRKLGDVEVSDTGGDLILSVVGGRTSNEDGRETGFVLAVAITRMMPVSSDPAEQSVQTWYAKNPQEFLDLVKGTNADLDDLCKGIVAYFDVGVMKETRQIVAELVARNAKNAAAKAVKQ